MGCYTFVTDCTQANGDDLNDMEDQAKEITRRTFLKYADKGSLKEIEEGLGYSWDFHMAGDWHVAYYRSEYRGKSCVYFVWSAIEHIFAGGE